MSQNFWQFDIFWFFSLLNAPPPQPQPPPPPLHLRSALTNQITFPAPQSNYKPYLINIIGKFTETMKQIDD